ncbi:hypothetical protein ABZW30_30330 [Kitasatospora sp. NPDC004669]
MNLPPSTPQHPTARRNIPSHLPGPSSSEGRGNAPTRDAASAPTHVSTPA